MSLQSCMGGFCDRREQCGHYQAANTEHQPAERLCPKGRDGAAQRESADMTRHRFSTAARVEQVQALLTPTGVTRKQLASYLGVSAASRMEQIMREAVAAGVAFETFARVSSEVKTPEMVYFPTANDRDVFRAAYDVEIVARKKARESAKRREKYLRNRSAEIAKRAAQRAEARQLREANAIAQAIERQAQHAERVRHIAEAEQRRQRQRLEKEAAAAEAARAKAEAKKTRQRLKVETAQAGQLVFKKGTDSPAPAKPKGPAYIVGEPDISRAKVTVAPPPPERFAANDAPRVIKSSQCRKWAEEVAA